MAGNRDLIEILREIRGSGAPGEVYTNGIWYELTIADKAGNPGIYGDILAKYGIITESAGTFDQAVAILENLNVVVTTLDAGTQATSALVNGVWQLGIPRGTAGIDGLDGFTPEVAVNYSLGNLNYTVTVDGTQITNAVLVDLDQLVDTVVNANVDVQTTLAAKQDVLDAVVDAQAITDGLDANVAAKIAEISAHTVTKIGELSTASDNEKVEIGVHADVKVAEYDANAVIKTHQYNDNHEVKLAAYNANDTTKLAQYNTNHIERLENLDEKYATRIIDMLNTNKILGMVDKFAATVPTQYATFLDTVLGSYIYYLNGTILTETVDYTVVNGTTIQMTTALGYGDIVTQVDSQYIGDYLTFEGVILEERIGQPEGVAGLDESGKVPAAQLPSYVDDVVEVATKAALPAVGEIGKIYVVVADETSNGDTSSYRWTGSIYAMVSNTLNAADVKALYESNANTNVFTDAEKSRVDIVTVLQTTAQTLPSAINELDTRIDNIVDNATLAEYGITDAYTKTEVQETLPAIGLDITNTTAPTRVGQMRWNQDEGTVDLALQNGITLQMGQENNRVVRNGTASAIANMTVCMFAGTIGNSGRILVAPFDGAFTNTNYIYGVATQSIAAGVDGYITIEGKVRNVNTTGAAVGEVWVDGDILYAKPNDAGTLTKVEPADDELKIVVASVVHAHTSGTLEVRVLPFNENMIAKRANKLTNARTIELSGDASGSVMFDGSANVNIAVTVADNSHNHEFANITETPTTLYGYGITDTYNSTTQDWRGSMMSKAQFNALAAERRVNRAGSGFDEFGKTYSIGYEATINDGMHVNSTVANSIFLGRRDSDGTGTSKTYYPSSNINGVTQRLDFIGANSAGLSSQILLPNAPTIYPYNATLTPEQIASGVIKHADSSNSGLITNGKFDTSDTSSFSQLTRCTLGVNAGQLEATVSSTTSGYSEVYYSGLSIGKQYTIEFDFISYSNANKFGVWCGDYITFDGAAAYTTVRTAGRKVMTFVAATTKFGFVFPTTTIGHKFIIDNIAVFPADAISRSDLVFLEQDDYVDVSVNDFVYPLGNKQYLGTTGDCGTTVVGSFAGSSTYSLFSDVWQADGALVGRGYVWSTLSDTNKKLFVSNPENNCYLDGDKVIQVQYRVRVEQGKSDTPLMSQYSFLQDVTKDAGLWYK